MTYYRGNGIRHGSHATRPTRNDTPVRVRRAVKYTVRTKHLSNLYNHRQKWLKVLNKG